MPSQLLSLNIHDSLTFGDVEICLSPDLGRFSPGDLVELSVWDRSKNKGNSPDPAAIKRSSAVLQNSATLNPSPSIASSNSSVVDGTIKSVSPNNKDVVPDAPPAAPPSIAPDADSNEEEPLFGSSIPNEDGSSTSSPAANNNTTNEPIPPSSSPLPTRTIVTPAALLLPPKPNTSSTKPPIQQQQQQQQRRRTAPAKTTRHVRDLSDMTLDTTDSLSVVGVDSDDDLRLSIVLLITEASLTSLKGGGRTQISILRQVADLYKLSPYDTVSIQKTTDDGRAHADFLLVTFKDQFISRGEIYLFQKSLIGSWVYEGKRLDESSRGYQATAREIRHASIRTNSGLVTEKTTITFRSRSSRIIWLVQMSAEMWDYCSPYERNQQENSCEIYFDNWIQFVYKLFDKWKELEATHSLTVVFFSRSFLNSASVLSKGPRDVYGRPYEDHYRIVIQNEKGPDWNALVLQLKKAFVAFPNEVGWTEDNSRQPSIASRGNVLEAINVTLNLLQFHYLDRDLRRTGNSLVIVSAGNGVFEVDKRLARISYQRMMDNGIGCDILSLALPALHIAPFFIYTHIEKSNDLDDGESQAQDYEVPHWMHLSFVSYESEEWVNVDRLLDTKGRKKEVHHDNQVPELSIGPHGFLLPRKLNQRSLDNNSPGSPATRKSHRQQIDHPLSPRVEVRENVTTARQLIAGRDIRDILDACRPRDFGRLPSSLQSLLRLKNHGPNKQADGAQDRFLEWGTMRFEATKSDLVSVPGQRMTSEGRVDRHSSSPSMLSLTPPRMGLMRNSTDLASSQSSSFASQFSSSFQNRGYGSNGLSVLLQRSLSLDEMADSGDSSDEEVDSSPKQHPSKHDFEQHIRELMLKRDQRAALKDYSAQASHKIVAEPPTLVAKKESGESVSFEVGSRGHPSESSFSNQRSTNQSGGIAEALVQYRTPVGGTLFATSDRGFQRVSRVNSMSRIPVSSPSMQRFHDQARLGLSPSLLIPPASSLMEGPAHDTNTSRQPLSTGADGRQGQAQDSSFSKMQEDLSSSNEIWLLRRQSRSPNSMETASRHKQNTHRNTHGRNLSTGNSSGISSNRLISRSPPKESTFRNDSQTTRVGIGTRRKRILNPFRQQDEDEVLKTKSFNRRRWSHVFPRGEMEFKRHAGPNWRSLTAPAILPLGVDYFPSLDDLALNYTFSPYNVTLEFQNNNFASHKELMDEMVRQRLAQDFQLVSPNSIDPVNFRRERHSTTAVSVGNEAGMIRHFLSMGYRMHVLTYDPSLDLVEVIRYESKLVRKFDPTYEYAYFAYCAETKSYQKVRQSFTKYADQYHWNRVDRLICGAEDREMREGMRFRRLMFGIVPPKQMDECAEKEYVSRFKRLLEYFERLRGKGSDEEELQIKVVTAATRPPLDTHERTVSAPNLGPDSMRRFYVQLRKGRLMEWMEVAVDSTFDTSWTYRIVFSWLVASSGKVDAQVTMLQRRCSNFQLELIPFPSVTTASNMFIQPFTAPSLLPVLAPEASMALDKTLRANGYIHDGIFNTEVKHILECLDSKTKYRFSRRGNRGRQFIHPSGTFFVRALTDLNESSILVVFSNHLYLSGAGKDGKRLRKVHEDAYESLVKIIKSLDPSITTNADAQPDEHGTS